MLFYFFKEIKYPVDNALLHSSDRWQTIGFYFVIRKMLLNIRLVIEWRQFPGQQDDRNSVFEIRQENKNLIADGR